MPHRLPLGGLGALACGLWALGCASRVPRSSPPPPAPAAGLVAQADRLRRRGRLDQAERFYERALQLHAGDVRAHAGLQWIGLLRGRDLALRRRYRVHSNPYLAGRLEGRSDRRREAFERAAEPWRSLGLGRWEEMEGNHEAASRLYRRLLRRDPGMLGARLGLARASFALGRVGAARDHFETALWTDPEHPGAAVGLSVAAQRRGDLEGALRWAVEALRRAPARVALAHRVYALARDLDDPQAGRGPARWLLEVEGADGMAALWAADLLRRAGDPRGAEEA
ncbi:MAG: tetratricopeptide repeat protein, partial [Planctomycetota bacterium]